VEAGTEFMTMTALANLTAHDPVKAPVTFVLSGNALVTIRYSDPTPFSLFITTATRPSSRKYISPDRVMVGLIEALIDRLAQVLELAGDDLDQISRDIFRSKEKRPNHISRNLEKLIERIGNKGDFLTMVQESLVSIVRLTTFHQSLEEVPSARDVKQELKLLQHDASALIEHAGFLSNKVTFLLDATLGLINLEQNAIIKIFSVAAVIFLPPTLVASLYGMNFRSMPELEWVFGYPYAIGLMIISAIVPYLFFKRKGWL
jgi:magnesium transporter